MWWHYIKKRVPGAEARPGTALAFPGAWNNGLNLKLYLIFQATVFSGHTKRVFALKFHPNDNNIFITAGWDDCMKVWDKRMAKNCKKFIPGPHICGPSLDIWDNEVISGLKLSFY